MLSRSNAVVHLLSAIYAWIVAGAAALMFEPLASSRNWYVLGLMGLASLGILDATAALRQWKKPPTGRLLSIWLHFAAFVTVAIIVAIAYSQSEARHFPNWLFTHHFTFVICLALVRLGLAAALLRRREMS